MCLIAPRDLLSIRAYAGSATRFDYPPISALPLPKGFKRSTPEIELAICTELNNCIEKLPSTTCTEMK